MNNNQAGKGDTYRKVKGDIFRQNYDDIFRKKEPKSDDSNKSEKIESEVSE